MQYSRECVLASIPTIGNKNPCVQKIPNYWRWLMLALSHIHINEWNIWVKLFESTKTQKNQLQSISPKYFMHLPIILKRATGTHNGVHFSTRPNNKGESRIAATSKIEHFECCSSPRSISETNVQKVSHELWQGVGKSGMSKKYFT